MAEAVGTPPPARGRRSVEPPPPIGVPLPAAEGVVRIVAPNPGPMTYHGTNSWLVEDGAGFLTLVDPGPDDTGHLDAILREAGDRLRHVLVSHWHKDHLGGAAALAARTGLAVHGHPRLREHFAGPLVPLVDGETVGGLQALFTPGHSADHVCFARAEGRILFTADHVMGWSTSVVPPPPEGNAGEYVASLRALLDRDDALYLSGHGPAIEDPRGLVTVLVWQRERREREVRNLLAQGPTTLAALVSRIYPMLKPGLDRAAGLNVEGLLAKIASDGHATVTADGTWELR